MDAIVLVMIWLAITVIDNLAKRKKRRVPPPRTNPPNFEIPTLPNDPNFPNEEVPIAIETPNQAEIRPKTPPPRTKKAAAQEICETTEKSQLELNFTPSTVMNAFVFSEILGKPKALRRR